MAMFHRSEEPEVVFPARTPSCRLINDVAGYRFGDIRPDDRVLDIGANAGGFCIRAARRAACVTAVEPVTVAALLENICANRVPVKVIAGALGSGRPEEICWDDCCVVAPTYRLHKLISMAGGCDFLKCDCEGAEWSIDPPELHGVRRIEMELHLPPISGPVNSCLLGYIGDHYHFEIERRPCHDILGVMGILHADRR